MKILPAFLTLVLAATTFILGGCVNESSQSVSLDTLTMHKFGKVSLLLTGVYEKEVTHPGSKNVVKDTGEIIRFSNYSCTWQGNTLSYDHHSKYSSSPTPPYYREDTRYGYRDDSIVDSISSTNQLTGSFSSSSSAYGKNHWGMVYENDSYSKRIVINTIPLIVHGNDTLVFSMKGQMFRDHIGTLESLVSNNINFSSTEKILNIIWNSYPAPELKITLTK